MLVSDLLQVGYVHRDIKPANLAVGRRGQETRVIHMLDFGLAREYVIRSEGTVKMRIPRTGTLFRFVLLFGGAMEASSRGIFSKMRKVHLLPFPHPICIRLHYIKQYSCFANNKFLNRVRIDAPLFWARRSHKSHSQTTQSTAI